MLVRPLTGTNHLSMEIRDINFITDERKTKKSNIFLKIAITENIHEWSRLERRVFERVSNLNRGLWVSLLTFCHKIFWGHVAKLFPAMSTTGMIENMVPSSLLSVYNRLGKLCTLIPGQTISLNSWLHPL